jgi:hypothetical protein
MSQAPRRDLGSISNNQFAAKLLTVWLDNPAMENLAERIKMLNKEKVNPEMKDYKNMSLEQLGKIVHRKGTTHTGKPYNQLWEKEGD